MVFVYKRTIPLVNFAVGLSLRNFEELCSLFFSACICIAFVGAFLNKLNCASYQITIKLSLEILYTVYEFIILVYATLYMNAS